MKLLIYKQDLTCNVESLRTTTTKVNFVKNRRFLSEFLLLRLPQLVKTPYGDGDFSRFFGIKTLFK